ncbi:MULTISPECIES: phage holin family protein [Streptomyces]|uniref:Phage holin family protein n=1 Tax=Streptomyces koyangensis TaxID=188770 RepID=A0A385D5V7_9ACTN|nr:MULTISPECIES: phage holin family protein [Streptomyces]MBZ2407073.1 phage holin family protein [Streptomyces sp. L06]AXQ53748.1 phage holin family protein [Streptomyces koyangensis]KLI99988.1 membrane protein [Streptomyces sp. KE1]MBL0801319.1 phage holin family protein [Streptomyces albidoflavus]MCG5123053.1 phage holin family protein [Streptomyces sp. T7(2022)]
MSTLSGRPPSPDGPAGTTGQQSVGDLVKQASEQIAELTRQELRLARAEMTEKGKRAGLGGGLFGAAGIVGFLALAALVATAIIALSLVWPPWCAALVVALLLGALAGLLAVLGKKEFGRAAPPVPEEAMDNVKADVAQIKEGTRR